jgi:lysophospholipase L1-like esterase
MYKLKFYFKKFATYFTITFLLFCLINVIAFVVINNTKRRSFETILQPEKKLESNPRLMQEIYLGKSVNEISKIQSDCPQNVSHPTLSFMMQPIKNENYEVGIENCRYDAFCNATNFYKNVNGGVWVFGGSTTFGVNVSSNQTYTSYLNQLDKDNHYFNFGISSYHQSLEIDRLILLLKKGYRPKKVIFMDGLNDITQLTYTNYSSSETPAKAHLAYPSTYNAERAFNNYSIVNSLPIVKLIILKNKKYQNNFEDIYSEKVLYHQNPLFHYDAVVKYLPKIEDLDKKVTDYYKNNLILIENLSKSYGFEYQVYFQPNGILYTKNSFVTNYADFKSELINYTLVSSAYEIIRKKIKNNELNMIDIADLHEHSKNPYVDLAHYSPELNKNIAKVILLNN